MSAVRVYDAVVAVGTFESKKQWLQSMQVVARPDVDFDHDDREREPRRVQLLVDVQPPGALTAC